MIKIETLYAHTQPNSSKKQLLTDHLQKTAKIASIFGKPILIDDLAFWAGIYHDIGKATNAFQRRLMGEKTSVDHSTAGAQELEKKYYPWGRLLAYVIAGHHGGLPDYVNSGSGSLKARLEKKLDHLDCDSYEWILKWIDRKNNKEFVEPLFFNNIKNQKYEKTQDLNYSLMFLTRMVYSCLVDADFIDTENFMNIDNSTARQGSISFDRLYDVFMKKMSVFQEKTDSKINRIRNTIFFNCIQAAKEKSGFFSLTVPTGGGKTLSSMGFALEHAKLKNKDRIIYAIPYTSIIEQNAEVFRSILGDAAVVEHHSNLEAEKESVYNRLQTENWDAPIIVTTNVQLFESLYNNRSSRTRKLHNIANSVIILDEAQMFPPALLQPILHSLAILVNEYSCSVVLCTATQPALNKSNFLPCGFKEVHEIIPDPITLAKSLNRVKTYFIQNKISFIELAVRIKHENQVLCIVNKKKDAYALYHCMKKEKQEGIFHLSTNMCPVHRKEYLNKIKRRLANGLLCKVVSTQIIEAGVDVDFPIVYRAMAGLDSIAQAAGRCNREAMQDYGNVYIFYPTEDLHPGQMKRSAESAERVIADDPINILSIENNMKYFKDFYLKESHIESRHGTGFDRKNIMGYTGTNGGEYFFSSMASSFKFIESDTYGVIVSWQRNWLLELKRYQQIGFFPKEIRRKLQQYTVNLYENQLKALIDDGCINDFFSDGQFMFLDDNELAKKRYDPDVGIIIEHDTTSDIDALIL